MKDILKAVKLYKKFKKAYKEAKKILANTPAKEAREAIDKWVEATLHLGDVITPFKDIALDLIELIKNAF